jgi:hypothetical protein
MGGNSDDAVPTEKAVKTYSTPLSYLDTDTTLAANSDVKLATQKAVKTYVDNTTETSITESIIDTDVNQITEIPITGDSVVDSVLREETDVLLSFGISEMVVEPTETEQTVEEVKEATEEEVIEEVAKSEEQEQKDAKKEAVKKAVAEKAKNLANEIANATSLEAQKQAQAQVLSLLSYVPDFNTYSIMMNGGVYPDAQGYENSTVPESRRGLRNGLAQQLLHEQMVQMQYAR